MRRPFHVVRGQNDDFPQHLCPFRTSLFRRIRLDFIVSLDQNSDKTKENKVCKNSGSLVSLSESNDC